MTTPGPPLPRVAVRGSRPAKPFEELPTRIGASAVIPDVLRSLGVDPAQVFEAANVDLARFADPDGLVRMADLARLVRLAVQTSGRPDLGLLIAERARADWVGVLGRLLASAEDLRSALHDLIRYFHINSRSGVAVLTVDDDVAEMQLALTGPYGDAAAVFEDATIGPLFHFMRALMGEAWRPSAVLLSHKPASGAARYRRFYGAAVRFNALRTAIVFPAADLDRPLAGSSRQRHAVVEATTVIASTRLGIGISEEVRWIIRARLTERNLSILKIAEQLGVSRRSLNRRLAKQGQTFARLLRSVRFAIARQLLVESATPLAQIARAIGYAEPSVFSRMFQRWSGVSPREWRRLHGRQ